MRNIFVIDGVVAGGSSVTDTLTALTTRKVAIIGDGALVIGPAAVAADLTGIKNVQFVTRLASGQLRYSVPVPRQNLYSNNMQIYTAPVNQVVQLGTGVALGALVIPSEGELNLLIKNLSYNHTISTQRITYSDTKKSTETPEAFIDRVVAGLNTVNGMQSSSIFTAVKLGSGANLGIQFTMANEYIDFYLGVDGILAGTPVTTTTPAKVSAGKGEDVVRMESNFSQFLGQAGYDTSDLWYTQPNSALVSENYNIATIGWEGIAPTPTNSIKVANNTLSFAFPTAASYTPFTTLLTLIFGNAFNAIGGAESGDPDVDEMDRA